MDKFTFDMDVTRERIRSRREELNLLQRELSEKAGIHSESVSRYEKEKARIPKIDALCLLADALECEPDYLLGRIPHPKRSTSDIAEKLPLRRDAIESLERMKYKLDNYSDFEAALLGYSVLSDLIIHIEKGMNDPVIDETGTLIKYDDFISNLNDMLSAYKSIADNEKLKNSSHEKEKDYRLERLTIRGTSTWLGNDIAEVIRQSVKNFVDPDNRIKEEA